MATFRNVDEAVVDAEQIGYENGIMIKASELKLKTNYAMLLNNFRMK